MISPSEAPLNSPGEHQPDLFAGTEKAVDRAFTGAHRIDLDRASWIEHIPGWLVGSDQLLADIFAAAGWEQRDRWIYNRRVPEPRLTAEYRDIADAPVPMLRTAAAALSRHYAVPYDGLWINLYRDHRDSTGWHGDRPTCKRDECIVPVLSLGAARRFLLKPRDGGRSIALAPASGDLVVMGGRCQRDWLHCVPKQARTAGMRISVNFSSRLQATPVRGGREAPQLPGIRVRPNVARHDRASPRPLNTRKRSSAYNQEGITSCSSRFFRLASSPASRPRSRP